MLLGVVAGLGLAPSGSARGLDVLRLPGRAISLAPATGSAEAVARVTVTSSGPRSVVVARSDFTLSVAGDMFAVTRWNAPRPRVIVAPRHSRTFRLTFGLAARAMRRGALYYRSAGGGGSGALPLGPSARVSTAADAVLHTFPLTQGVGNPWGTAVDHAGNIWFAEPGCDFAPKCDAGTPPGQIGRLVPSTGAIDYHPLPGIPGNQPVFLALDESANVWFTTPNNDMIGEFSPSTGTFVGQWPVTSGTGPWGLTFANGRLWYTEHLASAIGAFDPATHTHQDFPTPSPSSNPYGIAADGTRVWFTENNSSVNRIAVLDTAGPGRIAEYPLVAMQAGGTPHLIDIGPDGHPWWTEGWSNSIATLDPEVANAGSCGVASGPCLGVQRFPLPPPTACGSEVHTAGIAFDAARNRVWLDDSLTARVGVFTPSSASFEMTTLSNCDAHPHDGLSLDAVGTVWFDMEFANALGQLVPPDVSPPAGPPSPGTSAPPAPVAVAAPVNSAAPTISGHARQGRTLVAHKGSWTGNPTGFAYSWQRCRRRCANIAGAARNSYALTASDVDARVRVVVTARSDGGSAQAASRRAGPVGPSRQRVRTALRHLVASSAKHLAKGGYARFRAPSRGRLTLLWRARHAQLVDVRRSFARARAARIKTLVSQGGRRLLDHPGGLALLAEAVFKPVAQPAVTIVKRFRLSVP